MFNEIGTTYFSFHGGPSKYIGDIGGHSTKSIYNLYLENSTFFFGASLQKYFRSKSFLELGINVGKLTASDKQINFKNELDPEYSRYKRNLDFRTNITEGFLSYNIMPLGYFKNPTLRNSIWQPFITIGGAYYKFEPYGSYFDVESENTYWLSLPQFHTEGQGYPELPDRENYKLQEFNITYGGGLCIRITDRSRISLGISARKLFTDYLDDVSKTYIDNRLHYSNNSILEDADYAAYFSNKSALVMPFAPYGTGDIRGNSNNNDLYYNYYLKFGFRIKSKLSKKPNVYKYDNDEICF